MRAYIARWSGDYTVTVDVQPDGGDGTSRQHRRALQRAIDNGKAVEPGEYIVAIPDGESGHAGLNGIKFKVEEINQPQLRIV